MAAHKVFIIPELLELVLLKSQISRFDLFVLQHVSKAFNTTITNSPKLQRKLFATLTHNPRTLPQNQHKHLLAALQTHLSHILPFSDPPAKFLPLNDPPAKLTPRDKCFNLVVDYLNDGKPAGWHGKTKIHTTGSWRKITTGMSRTGIQKVIKLLYLDHRWNPAFVMFGPEGTLGDFVDVCEEVKWLANHNGPVPAAQFPPLKIEAID